MDEAHIRVSNLDRYQHYKERKPPWVKQYRDFWTDYDLSSQKNAVRLLALFMISFASEFENGTIPFDIAEISRRAKLNTATVRYGIQALITVGFLELDTPPLASKMLAPRKQNARPLVQRTEIETEAKASVRKRDPIWDALTAELGEATLTRSERGRWNKAVAELREAGATADDVKQRSAVYRRRWPGTTLTPTALSANWGSLDPKRKAKAISAPCPECGVGGGLHTAECRRAA